MPRKFAGFVLAVCITAAPGSAQTTTELLQKGIFAKETEGNLDSAILIYRQIVNSAPAQRDLAAQAQFRLGQALLQKGDLTSAAQEFDKLARDYADYRNLVSSLSAQNTAKRRGAMEATNVFIGELPYGPALASMSFDETKPVSVVGNVTSFTLMNPMSAIKVDGPLYHAFALAGATEMVRQGFTKKSFKPGDRVEVTGVLSVGEQNLQGSIAARADLVKVNSETVFDRSTYKAATTAQSPDEVASALRQMKLAAGLRRLAELTQQLRAMQAQLGDSNPNVVLKMKELGELEAQVRALKTSLSEGK